MQGNYETGIAPPGLEAVNDPVWVNRIAQIHLANHAITELLRSPAIGRWVAQVAGAKWVKLWGSQLYFKPPGQPLHSQVGLHRDAQYVPCIAEGGIFGWIPLTVMNEAVGPLMYLAGSCHYKETNGKLPVLKTLMFRGSWMPSTVALATLPCPVIPQFLKPGDMSLHHQDTLHGSFCNRSDSPRVAIAVSFVTDKTSYDETLDRYGIIGMIADPANTYLYSSD